MSTTQTERPQKTPGNILRKALKYLTTAAIFSTLPLLAYAIGYPLDRLWDQWLKFLAVYGVAALLCTSLAERRLTALNYADDLFYKAQKEYTAGLRWTKPVEDPWWVRLLEGSGATAVLTALIGLMVGLAGIVITVSA